MSRYVNVTILEGDPTSSDINLTRYVRNQLNLILELTGQSGSLTCQNAVDKLNRRFPREADILKQYLKVLERKLTADERTNILNNFDSDIRLIKRRIL